MSKTGYTKSKILELVGSRGKASLSYISEVLELNPSTVSQHLHELKKIGAIEEIKNDHIKKWKYYRLNHSFDQGSLALEDEPKTNGHSAKKAFFYAVVIGLIIVAGAGYALFSGGITHPQKGEVVKVFLTDPPLVPEGTQALYINYSSVAVHVDGSEASNWIQSNTSGTIDIISLVKSSHFIAGIQIPNGSKIDALSMNITAARIVINGSEFDVILRSGQITTSVQGNSNSSTILLDLSPTVTPMYINGVNVLVMLTQAGSVFLNQSADSNLSNMHTLNSNELQALKLINPNMSITNCNITTSPNDSVRLTLTVANHGNKTVVLHDVLILGEQDIVNSTTIYVPVTSLPVSHNHMGAEFLVSEDGALAFANTKYLAPSLERINYVYPYVTSGYALPQNSTVTMAFDGRLAITNDSAISLIKGISYKVAVLGDYVSHLSVNVTSG